MPFVSLSLSHRDAPPSWPEMMALAQDDAGALCFLICSPVCFPPCQLQIKQEEARGVPVITTLLGGLIKTCKVCSSSGCRDGGEDSVCFLGDSPHPTKGAGVPHPH